MKKDDFILLAVWVPKQYNSDEVLKRISAIKIEKRNIELMLFPTEEKEFRISCVYPLDNIEKIKKIKESLKLEQDISKILVNMGYQNEKS